MKDRIDAIETGLISILIQSYSNYTVSLGRINLCSESEGYFKPVKYVVEWEEYFNPHDNYNKSDIEFLYFDNAEEAAKCFVELCNMTYNCGRPIRDGYYLLGDKKIYF